MSFELGMLHHVWQYIRTPLLIRLISSPTSSIVNLAERGIHKGHAHISAQNERRIIDYDPHLAWSTFMNLRAKG